MLKLLDCVVRSLIKWQLKAKNRGFVGRLCRKQKENKQIFKTKPCPHETNDSKQRSLFSMNKSWSEKMKGNGYETLQDVKLEWIKSNGEEQL